MDILPGTTVYSTGDCGDFWNGKHVTIPKGIQGTLVRFYHREDWNGQRPYMAEISIPESPGQKLLECRAEEIATFWATEPPPPKPVRPTVWTRLRENLYT